MIAISWNDKQTVRVINYLRDKYQIRDFVETGTYRGVNAKLHAAGFGRVLTCEKDAKLFRKAEKRLKACSNVTHVLQHSPDFLKEYVATYRREKRKDTVLVFLDAHFYDPNLPRGTGKFVILDELKSLRHFNNSVVIVHDFDNNLGHITYDGISLDLDLVGPGLKKINPNFHFYTNTLASCDILRPDHKDIRKAGLEYHRDVLDVLKIAWKEPRFTFRGVLYAVPKKLTTKELENLGLRKWQ